MNKKFKSLNETYKIYTFLASVGLMYPNPKTDKKRAIAILFMIVYCIPIYMIMINDLIIRIKNRDMENTVRQMIIGVSLCFVNTKAVLTVIYKDQLRKIFEKVNKDYDEFNYLPEIYHDLIEDTIKMAKFLEIGWTFIFGLTTANFPGTAVILNIYYAFFTDNPRKFMVHEAKFWKFSDELAYSSPVYEIFFVYSCGVVLIIFLGYIGFDGMFSVCTLHVSLKIKILARKLQHVLNSKLSAPELKANITYIVKEQYKIYEFKDELLKCYEVWLVLIFVLSIVEAGMALTQTTQGSGGNLLFIVFICACTGHIFFPCYMTSDVTHTAEQFADDLYSCSWEDIQDPSIRRSISFMISRAQIPLKFMALKLLTYDMAMFVSVMQTAYSMFTLLRQ